MIRTSTSRDNHTEWESASSSTDNPISLQVSGDVDDTARALQDLPMLQSPPSISDNGGNYLQKFHGCSPLGTATASAHGPLDPVLVAGLENARERMTLLKFEDQIVRFLKNSKEPHLNFPPLSSYHRLIIHRLAQRCGLEHQTADYNPVENGSARVVTLFKTMQSAVPRILLIDLSSDRQTSTVTPASAPRIMMRRRSALRPGANGGRGNGGDKVTPSLQDRERAYAEARARIFGEDNGTASVVSTEISNGPRHGSRQANGPDGSKGFGRVKEERISANESNGFTRASQPSALNAASWKESKVLWRNREQELNDPDFTRNHDAFRPRSSCGTSSGSGSGSGSGSESPYHGNRFGSGMQFGHADFHDRSYNRSYGLQQQQMGGALPPHPPPLPMSMVSPGRDRHHVGEPDYNNRVDTNLFQRSPHQQYHTQQQYHAQQQFQQHQLIPPPSMVMERGGYGYPSPQGRPFARQGNWIPPHASTSAVGSNGFIEDDFSPLGK
ncbi:unnamed protein product [Peronospora destructor]|uniref:R3H domain-containing protein n=1 Tax=Peronospora destructor TaxID=86335 RepID=A0AAV0V590_9STRA|nr:unnamed protein product [Peronospora destructor]